MFLLQHKPTLAANFDPYFVSINDIKKRMYFSVLLCLLLITGTITTYIVQGNFSLVLSLLIAFLTLIGMVVMYDSIAEYKFFKKLMDLDAVEQKIFEEELKKKRIQDRDAPLIGVPLAKGSIHDKSENDAAADAIMHIDNSR